MSIDFSAIESSFRADTSGACAMASDGMIATQSGYATAVGKEILKINGNAVDAAVAAALALGICEPQASGIGGQTMLLLGNGKKIISVEGSSRAPTLAHTGSISHEERAVGYRATTVPSTLATLWYTHNRYGKLKWKQLLKPVIKLAEEGYPISALQGSLLNREMELFKKVPSKSGMRYFYSDGKPYLEGEIFKQPDLAALFRELYSNGIKEFYRGHIAHKIDSDMRENGGLLRYDDLALIPFPIERAPRHTAFRGLTVYTMPPPGAGRTLIYALNMLNCLPPGYAFNNEHEEYHLLVRIIQKVFYERENRPYAADFFPQISHRAKMLDHQVAYKSMRKILKTISKGLSIPEPMVQESPGETTHLSVIDKNGLSVSLTQSIERVYGSKAAADGLGFLYNNYIMDYNYSKPEHPYYLRPNSKPWATVAPTLIYNGDQIWMSVGSPGSERIVSSILTFLHLILDRGYSMDKAMKAPRIHATVAGKISLEAGRFEESLIEYLHKKSYKIDKREDYSFYLGCIQAIIKKQSEEGFQGVADVRRDGQAM